MAKNTATRNVSARTTEVTWINEPGAICLDELVESFDLIQEDSHRDSLDRYRGVDLDPVVSKQLLQYVADIAGKYHAKNRFHNFDHVS